MGILGPRENYFLFCFTLRGKYVIFLSALRAQEVKTCPDIAPSPVKDRSAETLVATLWGPPAVAGTSISRSVKSRSMAKRSWSKCLPVPIAVSTNNIKRDKVYSWLIKKRFITNCFFVIYKINNTAINNISLIVNDNIASHSLKAITMNLGLT